MLRVKGGLDFTMINGDIFHNDLRFREEVKTLWQTVGDAFFMFRTAIMIIATEAV